MAGTLRWIRAGVGPSKSERLAPPQSRRGHDFEQGVKPGDSIALRFDFGQDGCTGYLGRYVDDVKVVTCRAKGHSHKDAVVDQRGRRIAG